jgi:hypothetical protein
MVRVLRFFPALLAWFRSSQARREAEILYLRQRLIILRRSAPARPRLKAVDRLIFVCLYRLFPSLIDASIVFQPETLLRWHRRGFRLFWRWKSQRVVGRPALPADIRSLVRRISRENPLWGAPRIELLKLGIAIAQTSVAKYMVRRPMPTITIASVPIFRSKKTPLLVVPCRWLDRSGPSPSRWTPSRIRPDGLNGRHRCE